MLQWLQPHRREKCFAKPEEVIHSHHSMQVSFLFYFFIFYPISCICSQRPNFKLVTMGNQSPEPVDETMSFRCKNKKLIYSVVHLIQILIIQIFA